ncbi:MAG: hypothetical protein J6O17_09260 [Eubacterium sp.]|nr:hypothetical protein [Eubacterium sp.]
MSNFRTIGLIVLSVIMMIECIWMTSSKNKKGMGKYIKGPDPTFIPFFLALLFIMFMIMFGSIFIIDITADGAYVFRDEKIEMNSGNIPEMGEFVSVKFDEVGEAFCPEGREGVYYTVVIYDESGNSDKSVCAVHVNESERSTFEKYKENPEGVLEYSGRILEINNYYDLYTQTVKDSGMLGNGYHEKRFVVDATVRKEDLKERFLYFGISAAVCLICAIVSFVIYKKLKNRKK